MTVFLEPIRIADGEQNPETCAECVAEGYRVHCYRPLCTFYYQRRADAETAKRLLSSGHWPPPGGDPWWPRATVYLK